MKQKHWSWRAHARFCPRSSCFKWHYYVNINAEKLLFFLITSVSLSFVSFAFHLISLISSAIHTYERANIHTWMDATSFPFKWAHSIQIHCRLNVNHFLGCSALYSYSFIYFFFFFICNNCRLLKFNKEAIGSFWYHKLSTVFSTVRMCALCRVHALNDRPSTLLISEWLYLCSDKNINAISCVCGWFKLKRKTRFIAHRRRCRCGRHCRETIVKSNAN